MAAWPALGAFAGLASVLAFALAACVRLCGLRGRGRRKLRQRCRDQTGGDSSAANIALYMRAPYCRGGLQPAWPQSRNPVDQNSQRRLYPSSMVQPRGCDLPAPALGLMPIFPKLQGNGAIDMARGKAKRAGAAKAAKKPKAKAGAQAAKKPLKPIELYYWPTPNGFKISIMLEECKLPYTLIPVNISRGDQFKPDFLKISPNNRMPAIVDPDGPGGRPISIFESGAILQYLGRKTGKFYPSEERARRGRSVAVLADGRHRADGRAGPPLQELRGGDLDLRDQPLRQRGQSALRRDEHPAEGPRIPRRQIFDRRHGLRRLGQSVGSGRARTSTSSRISSAGWKP